MKKLFLSVAALLCAALMFSQNDSDVKQTGFDQYANVDQQGYNFAIVRQETESNIATITQDGDGVDEATAQTAIVLQYGYSNDADVVQGSGIAWGNHALARQHGVMNVSRQTQLGDFNDGLVVQGNWIYGNSYQGLAVQEQYSPIGAAKGNDGDIWQFGYENVAYQTQYGEDNSAYIEQWTGYNYASQFQDGEGNNAAIIQDGMENHAVQEQYGFGNNAWAAQNYFEDWWDDGLSGDNFSVQYQNGENNDASVAQDSYMWSRFNTTAGGDTYELETPVYSGSKNNTAFQNQWDFNHRAYSYQTGMYNLSEQNQFGDGNFSFIQQDGFSNYATDWQNGYMNRSGVYQLGEFNESYVEQYGSFHSSKVDQDGFYNKANILQND